MTQMKKVIFEFAWTMTDYWARGTDPAGILFHKWLPNNRKDEICLLDQENIKLNVWFERRGFLDSGGGIKYTDDKDKMMDLKENTLKRHAKLESGPLFIELVYPLEQTDEEKIITRDAESKNGKYDGLNDYQELGKNIYKLLYEKISVLIYTLKHKFGQIWIDDFPCWDSTTGSLGHYFSMLQAKCSMDGNKYKFVPSHPIVTLVAEMMSEKEFLELITESDWQSLKNKDFLESNPACEYLVKSIDSCSNDELRNAYIDACIALELVMSSLFLKFPIENLERFFDMPRKTQLCVVANLVLKDFPDSIITNACKAIDIRNEIMHRGYVSKKTDEKYFTDLIVVIKKLLGCDIKTPHKNIGQIIWNEPK